MELIVNRLNLTTYNVALAVIVAAICMLAAGAYFSAALAENRLGYLAFRAWAFDTLGLATLAVGCTVGFANFLWRKTRSSGRLAA